MYGDGTRTLFGEPADGARKFFEDSMRAEPILLVRDNFETFDEQEAAYQYLEDLVEPPAKVVITSRHVFRGDYAVEVKGMSEHEAEQLLLHSARCAGIEPLMTPSVRQRVFERCQGHPYAMKLVASQLKSESGLTDLLTQVLRKSDLLDALFRRSLEDLQYDEDSLFVFLLAGQLAGGISEAAARTITEPGSIDLDKAVGELLRRSLIEVRDGPLPTYDACDGTRVRSTAYSRPHPSDGDLCGGGLPSPPARPCPRPRARSRRSFAA
jgi:hypothetical protein